ncbi:AMP-binding protein [Streptomyces sp. JJ38]|uniref:AMP-binding protein n=1 Tax=Streptomyces sp. JJ38 TaxID=2738128 RepID=UPI001C596939|nr:AMP-binding protein [Streptomyces sp. JJ38]MBW1597706.1 AMP-binding protein [Streptomyces sp. JJ38]
MSADQHQNSSPLASSPPGLPAFPEFGSAGGPAREAGHPTAKTGRNGGGGHEGERPRPSTPPPTAEYLHPRLLGQARLAAGALRRLGAVSGERVAVLLPMSPESVVVTMACGRLDALRVSLPMGAPEPTLRQALREAGARILVVADACEHAGGLYPAKQQADRVLADCPTVRSVIVVHHVPRPVPWVPGRDLWWHQALDRLGP